MYQSWDAYVRSLVGVAGLELCIRGWPIPRTAFKLHSRIRGNSVPRLPNITYLLVITAITDSVTPGSWRGFVQDFLKPRRLLSTVH